MLATNILAQIPGELRRVKHTEAGNAYASGFDNDGAGVQFLYGAGGARPAGPWAQLPTPGAESNVRVLALGVLALGTTEHAVFGVPQAGFYWHQDQQPARIISIPPGYGVVFPQAADVFPSGPGVPPTALLGTNVGLFRVPLGPMGAGPVSEVPLPPGQPSITSVDVNAEAGSPYGSGFGMALMNDNGNTVVLRAVPGKRPEEIGAVWKASVNQPVLPAVPAQVDCLGAQLCVATLATSGTPNVAIYRNVHSPEITVGPGTAIPESSTGTLFVGASDDDGDPVRLTVERLDGGMPPDGGPSPLSFVPIEKDGGVELQLTSLPVCEDTIVPVQAIASDGWRMHDERVAWNLRVIHTVGPDAPSLNTNAPNNTVTVQAGGEAGVITVNEPASRRCRIDRYYWEALSGSAEQLNVNGTTATFPTPTVLCDQNGRSYAYRVHAIDEGGASASTDFNVQVRPWGRPSAAFGADAGVGIDAGQAVTLVPTAEHLCQTAQGYPGVDTRWELTGGQLPLENIELTTAAGDVITGTSAVTPRLVVQTRECADAELTFQVRHYTRDGSGIEGPASTVKVSVDPKWAAASTGTLTLNVDQDQVTAKTVGGRSEVSNLNCLPQRGGTVKANIRLERPDGTVVRQGEFSAPGTWGFLLDQTCGPATTYNVVGELVDVTLAGKAAEGSLSVQPLAPVTVEVPSGATPLEPLYEPRITARCGRQPPARWSSVPWRRATTLPVSWEQIGGPALTQATFTGSRIDVATQESDFGALIGQKVAMRMRARTVQESSLEPGDPDHRGALRRAERHTERATGADAGARRRVGGAATTPRRAGCARWSHVERLEGVDYVAGSARFNGEPVEAELDGDRCSR